MGPIAMALSDEEMHSVAKFFSTADAPKAPDDTATTPQEIAKGANIASVGDWTHGLPACGQCHGPQGQGVGPSFPALAGQSASYITAQLVAWQQGARSNDPLNLMTGVAAKLGDAKVAAVAAYYASLPVPQGQPAEGAKP